MKTGFIPIEFENYIERHLEINPNDDPSELRASLLSMLQAFQNGTKCSCGKPLWVIGSAISGRHACFSCLSGEPSPDDDYELLEACGTVKITDDISGGQWKDVAAMFEAVTGEKIKEKDIQSSFERNPLNLFLWDKEKIIGFGSVYGNAEGGIVKDVIISQDYQGKGLGKLIINTLRSKGRKISLKIATSAISTEEFSIETGKLFEKIQKKH